MIKLYTSQGARVVTGATALSSVLLRAFIIVLLDEYQPLQQAHILQ